MTKRKSKKGSRKSLLITLCVVAAVVAAIVWALFFHAMSKGGERYIYISPKDKLEDVYDKLRPISNTTSFADFRLLASVWVMVRTSVPDVTPSTTRVLCLRSAT